MEDLLREAAARLRGIGGTHVIKSLVPVICVCDLTDTCDCAERQAGPPKCVRDCPGCEWEKDRDALVAKLEAASLTPG